MNISTAESNLWGDTRPFPISQVEMWSMQQPCEHHQHPPAHRAETALSQDKGPHNGQGCTQAAKFPYGGHSPPSPKGLPHPSLCGDSDSVPTGHSSIHILLQQEQSNLGLAQEHHRAATHHLSIMGQVRRNRAAPEGHWSSATLLPSWGISKGIGTPHTHPLPLQCCAEWED